MTDALAAAVEAIRARPADGLLALDVDGTLAPIVDRPEDARLADGGREALAELVKQVGTVALVTGRPAADVVRLGGLEGLPGLHVLGHYGLQSWHDGRIETPAADPGVPAALAEVTRLVAGAADGVVVEDKEHSVAVHTRRARDPQAALDALAAELDRIGERHGLEAVPGRYVIELRPPGVDKGVVLRRLVASTGARAVVYVGDDLGDLPAFRAVGELRASGVAAAAVASVDPASPDAPAAVRDAADAVLDGPDAVVAWLRELTASLA